MITLTRKKFRDSRVECIIISW